MLKKSTGIGRCSFSFVDFVYQYRVSPIGFPFTKSFPLHMKSLSMPAARDRADLIPTLAEETRLWEVGYTRVAGLDEVGRGALAGPVVAAAVIVPEATSLAGVWATVRDSKLLSPAARVGLFEPIQAAAHAWGIGIVPAAQIDAIGVAAATRQAMMQALAALCDTPDYLLIDWVRLRECNVPQLCVAKADQKMVSVAAASILAKVTRDRLLEELADAYPQYGFGGHKGYGTSQHLAAISDHGPCAEHRHSFAPIATRATLWHGAE
jgi:ribonuclease HII